jgi:replicative DNA helicase
VPAAVADRYALELHALAATLAVPASDDGPALLALDPAAGELLLAFERDLEPRLAAGSGDLAHLAGWAVKLAGATCRLAALLHLASHLRDGWARPITADTFAGAAHLADYLIDHARAVFDLRRRVTPFGWLEPVEAHHRTGHQDEREPPPRIAVPPHLQPPEAAQP